MAVDVAILTKNSSRYLRQCLDAIYKNIPVNRLIIIDGGSTDDTLGIVNEYQNKKKVVVLQDQGTRATARQKAIAHIKTQWFMFVDSDIVLCNGWFQEAQQFMKPKIGLISGYAKVMNPRARARLEAILALYKKMGKASDVKELVMKSTKWRTASNNMLVRLKAIRNIKIPWMFHVLEDVYMKNWVEKQGYKAVISPESCSFHYGALTASKEELVLYGQLAKQLKIIDTCQLVKRFILSPFRNIWIFTYTRNLDATKASIRNDYYPCVGWLKSAFAVEKYPVHNGENERERAMI